jgi:hypothetical protein
MFLLDAVGHRLAQYLAAPRKDRVHSTTAAPIALAQTLRPGDVLLVEGSSHIASTIKYLTQSTWSHATLCIAPPDPLAMPDWFRSRDTRPCTPGSVGRWASPLQRSLR